MCTRQLRLRAIPIVSTSMRTKYEHAKPAVKRVLPLKIFLAGGQAPLDEHFRGYFISRAAAREAAFWTIH
jgi:hypothetical protein